MTTTLYVSLLLLVGLTGGWLTSKINLPSVTGYILSGLILGPSVLNIITGDVYNSLGFVNELALGILAISVGTELHRDMIKRLGRDLTILSVANTLLSFVLTTAFTYFLGLPITYALVLGALSMTVSPSGVVSMVKETRARGEMTQTLLGLVAFDNLITIIVFGIVVAFVTSVG
ncbi:MAG TPA: cation:proton antiporter, partial [Atopostipes sp.]|nr:cation:proton antiporter [Atopostipes sp.]